MKQSLPFGKNLTAWYRRNARDLPWRKTSDPYKIWISEVMLQQTTVNAVIPYYQRWMKRFPTLVCVAQAPRGAILKMWQGLGYYQRAKNIHRAARMMCKNFREKIPSTAEDLKKLPGFGHYTVGAVLSIAFDMRHPIVDANVRRVMMRLLAVPGHADAPQDKHILKFLERVMPEKKTGLFNQALMELGALVCRSRVPLCLLCPVRGQCAAYAQGIQEIIPAPRKRVLKDVDVAVGLIKKDGRYFIQKRPSKGLLADLWEFPGGKMERGETPLTALRRELKEELGVALIGARPLLNLRHFYTQFRVNLNVFSCEVEDFPASDRLHKWVDKSQFSRYAMPSGTAKIIDRLKKGMLKKASH